MKSSSCYHLKYSDVIHVQWSSKIFLFDLLCGFFWGTTLACFCDGLSWSIRECCPFYDNAVADKIIIHTWLECKWYVFTHWTIMWKHGWILSIYQYQLIDSSVPTLVLCVQILRLQLLLKFIDLKAEIYRSLAEKGLPSLSVNKDKTYKETRMIFTSQHKRYNTLGQFSPKYS